MMIFANSSYLGLTAGRLKMISIALITAVVALSSFAVFGSEYFSKRDDHKFRFSGEELNLWREFLLPGISAMCFVLSSINLIVHVASAKIYWNIKTAYVDFLYHSISALLLASSGVMLVVGAVLLFGINCKTDGGCQHFQLKLGSGFLSMITGLMYGVTGVVVLTNRKEVEREYLWKSKSQEGISNENNKI